MDRPASHPAIAGAPTLPTAFRYEPPGATASDGFPPGSTLPARSYNWVAYFTSQWLRFHEEQGVQLDDLFEFGTTAAYKVTSAAVDFVIGGPLTQSSTVEAVYYSSYGRIRVKAGLTQFTFPPASTTYIHAKPQPDPTSRDVEPAFVLDNSPTLAGYTTLTEVVTDATTIVSVTDLTPAGVTTPSQWTYKDAVAITQTYSSGPAALAVTWPSGAFAAAVTLIAQGGAVRDGLFVQINDGGTADGRPLVVDAWTTFAATAISQSEPVTNALEVTAVAGDAVTATVSGAGRALVATVADPGAAAAEIDASGAAGADALVLTPLAVSPTPGRAGGLWVLGGFGSYALQFRDVAAGPYRYVHSSQDTSRALVAFTALALSVGPATGPVTLQTTTRWCVQGGTYLIVYEYHGGRTQGSTCIPQIDCRVAGATIPGGALQVFDHPNPNNVGGPYTTVTFHRTYLYYHGGASAFVTFDMRTTTTAGAGTTSYANRAIYWAVIES